MSSAPRMEAHQVVEASLSDLAAGVLMSIPGLEDLDVLTQLQDADQRLVGAGRAVELPDRYRPAPM